MEGVQLSLWDTEEVQNKLKKKQKEKKLKQPKLGRYERLRRELETQSDPYKKFITVEEKIVAPSKYKFVDIFSGAGGMTLGLVKAGFEPIASVEINQIASSTYQKNFPKCRHFCGDIKDFSSQQWLEEINSPKIHLVVGGPPCQGFSVAGKRNPRDNRNYLFREFVRVVAEVRPWYVIMENVPGILTIGKGKIRKAIYQAFKNIGYSHISVAILESAAYGIPQIRPRAIFIANRFANINPYPKPQLKPDRYKPIESAISDLPSWKPIPEINHEWTKHSPEYMKRIAKVPPGGSLYETYADAFKRQYPGNPSMTIKENHGGTHIHPNLDRTISAREMARLQSFPDRFIFAGSMKKAMWQIGNAVPPRLAECLGYALIPYLQKIDSQAGRVSD